MASKKGKKVHTIIANRSDPLGGEDSFTFYNRTNPKGDRRNEKDIEHARGELRGLGGKKVRVTLLGEALDKDTAEVVRQTRNSTTITLNRYGDLFGTDGALLELLKRQIERDSEMVYLVMFLEVEEIS